MVDLMDVAELCLEDILMDLDALYGHPQHPSALSYEDLSYTFVA